MAEGGGLRDDPLRFRDAVFYEAHVRGFYDSNGDLPRGVRFQIK
jgi:pullulanase/glycogen debranching enzyme